MTNVPQKEGYYWARDRYTNWFNLIVNVYGSAPFFKIRYWDIKKDILVENVSSHNIEEWGNKIEQYEPTE